MRFLLLLAQQHEDFRAQELEAIAELLQIELKIKNYDRDSPFLEVDLQNEDDAKRLISRSILARAIYRIYSQAPTLEELHRKNRNVNFSDLMGKSFKVEFSTFRSTRSYHSKMEEILRLSYMNLDGPIKMKGSEVTLVFIESYEPKSRALEYVWFTKLIGISDRTAMDKYNLKKRRHVGTTSFDAELALVTSNLAQVQKGDLVYDPFSGTGSFPLAAAHHGAYVYASDIDIRPLHKYADNFDQYGTSNKFLGGLEMDFTHNAFHPRLKLDAIICDPPYGVRERIVVCGAADPERFKGKENIVIENELSHRRRDYIATKKPYELSMMINDLFEFASARLNEHRRLSFWLPLEEGEAETTKIPLHKDLDFKSICIQKFAKWERWLLTYQRRPYGEIGEERPVELDDDFREKYFARYRK